ncbi:hypothetical protein [Xylanimonas protaetiae]|uniref:Uncharacterized protein n=1 Tax=Xylanimonas protaetiae TaxID=2509457 RepID=A0A4V0YG91_9MICO|nr:hypothetical protein [Xylanimonas protaetiae]QAY70391.1 hypothetical protein ET471_10400 [Xylanimonas protaetiae]
MRIEAWVLEQGTFLLDTNDRVWAIDRLDVGFTGWVLERLVRDCEPLYLRFHTAENCSGCGEDASTCGETPYSWLVRLPFYLALSDRTPGGGPHLIDLLLADGLANDRPDAAWQRQDQPARWTTNDSDRGLPLTTAGPAPNADNGAPAPPDPARDQSQPTSEAAEPRSPWQEHSDDPPF